MKNYILSTLVLLYSIGNIYSQEKSDVLKIGNYTYPSPSIANFIRWLDLSTMQWEDEMKKSQLKNRGIENNCVFYGSGGDLKDAEFSYDKCPGNLMSVEYHSFSKTGVTPLDKLVNELEPFYKESESGRAFYRFKLDGKYYEFMVYRIDGAESAYAKKVTIK